MNRYPKKREALAALLVVKDQLGYGLLNGSNKGLCHHFNLACEQDINLILTILFKRWPKYSGLVYYPVPHPKEKGAKAATYVYQDKQYPKWVGAYGALRVELLNFCISELERELSEC